MDHATGYDKVTFDSEIMEGIELSVFAIIDVNLEDVVELEASIDMGRERDGGKKLWSREVCIKDIYIRPVPDENIFKTVYSALEEEALEYWKDNGGVEWLTDEQRATEHRMNEDLNRLHEEEKRKGVNDDQ